jgi:glycosyltransferase involved in cell wall biosynthesis
VAWRRPREKSNPAYLYPEVAMKALYLDSLPEDSEGQKSKHRDTFTIMGAYVYSSEVFRALLEHSTYEKILLPLTPRPVDGDFRDSEIFLRNADRIEFVSNQELGSLGKYDRLVFMTYGMDLARMERLRRLSRVSTAPIMGAIHSINSNDQLRTNLLLLVARLRNSDALTCSSTAGKIAIANFMALLADRLEQCGLPRLTAAFQTPVIPLGVDTKGFHRSGGAANAKVEIGEGPVVLYVGRFSPTSKADLVPLVISFGKILKQHPTAKLILAGDDTRHQMMGHLVELASSVAPGGNIQIVANPDSTMKKRLYSLADVFVSPSDSLQETFGITVIEAMAAGLPVIVSDWNGYKDLVIDGETGFKVSTTLPVYPQAFDDLRGPGNMVYADLLAATTMVDWREFGMRLCGLLSDKERRSKMGDAARRRAIERYDWSVIISTYEALWDELSALQALDRGVTGGTALDLDFFSYLQIFSHYSSMVLSDDAQLRLVEPDWQQLVSSGVLRMTSDWFRDDIFRSITSGLWQSNTATVGEVIKSLGSETDQQVICHKAHLCRLIKYGAIELLGGGWLA